MWFSYKSIINVLWEDKPVSLQAFTYSMLGAIGLRCGTPCIILGVHMLSYVEILIMLIFKTIFLIKLICFH